MTKLILIDKLFLININTLCLTLINRLILAALGRCENDLLTSLIVNDRDAKRPGIENVRSGAYWDFVAVHSSFQIAEVGTENANFQWFWFVCPNRAA